MTDALSPRWRTRLKKIPGVSGLTHRLFSPAFEGAWLYRQEVVSWLYDGDLRRQLPWPFRAFAAYSALQRPLWDDVVWGYPALRAAMALRERLGLADHTRLQIGPYVVFVSLRDPRLLQVPNEIASPAADTRVLALFLRPGDTFADVGANHGSFSIVASHLVGGDGALVAVEPQPRLAHLVERSLEANAPDARRDVYAIACSDHTGSLRLYVPRGSSGSATLLDSVPTDSDWDALTVPVERFDDAVAWRDLPGEVFLKLDVEGGEMAFLRGAREMIRTRRPTLMIEINPERIASAEGPEQLVALVRELSYRSYVELDAPESALPLADIDLTRQRNVILLSEAPPAARS